MKAKQKEDEDKVAAKEKVGSDFQKVLEDSQHLDDLLPYLANHIWNGLNCSGVYIG
jgi:hypothetical protein